MNQETENTRAFQDQAIKSDIEKLKDILFKSEKKALVEKIQALEKEIEKLKSDDFLYRKLNEEKVSNKIHDHIEGYLKKAQADEAATAFSDSMAMNLARAIETQSSKNPSEIANSLAPIIGKGIQFQIKNEKDKIVDALYPVIGTTITKYLSEALKDIMDGINDKIEEKASIKGLVQKIKASVLGVSQAELLFQSSIQPKIKSIFIIHKKTGLAIADAHSEEIFGGEDTNMVAGMFSAITSFINSWIQKDEKFTEVDSIDYGESQIFFETSNSIIAAVVVDQGFKKSLRVSVRKFLELFHTKYYDFIIGFDGDADSIPPDIKAEVASLIKINKPEKTLESQKHSSKKIRLYLLLSIFVCFLTYFGYGKYKKHRISSALSAAFLKDPFIGHFKLKPVHLESNLWSVTGAVTSPEYLSRISAIVDLIAPESKVITTDLTVLNSGFKDNKISSFVDEKLAEISSDQSYSSIETNITPFGELRLKGYSDRPILASAFNKDSLFTKVSDTTKNLDLFKNNVLFFETRETKILKEGEKKLLKIVNHLKKFRVKNVTLYIFSDSPNTSPVQKNITMNRVENIKTFLSKQYPQIGVSLKFNMNSPFSNVPIASLNEQRAIVVLPVIK